MRNKKKLKSLAVMLIVSALVLAVSACGGNKTNNVAATATPESSATVSAEAKPSEETKKDPVTLTFSTFNAWWTGGNIQEAIKLYEAETGNKIDAQIFPDDQFANVISTKLATGETPDVFAIWPAVTQFNIDHLEPLEGEWTSKIDMERAKKYSFVSLKDGKFYTAPYGPGSFQGIMYNKEVLRKAGVTPPFKTYQEFIDAIEKIKAIGVTPLTLSNKEGWTTQILVYAGSHYVVNQDPQFGADLASNKVQPKDKPGLVDLFKRVLDLKGKGYTNENDLSTTMAMAEQALAEGKTAMVFGGSWLSSDFDKNYPDQAANIGMTAVNWGDNPADLGVTKGASGFGMFVPKNAKHKAEALEFVNFIMSEKAMKAMYEVVPGVNELGIATKANAWDQEMQGMVDSGVAKATDNVFDAINNAFPGSGFVMSDFSALSKSIWVGKDLTKSLEDWYSEYAKLNKVKKIKGF